MESVEQESSQPVPEQQTTTEQQSSAQQPATQEVSVLDIPVTSENVALNILVTFVNLAQKRGAFNIKESAKIWECIEKFQRTK